MNSTSYLLKTILTSVCLLLPLFVSTAYAEYGAYYTPPPVQHLTPGYETSYPPMPYRDHKPGGNYMPFDGNNRTFNNPWSKRGPGFASPWNNNGWDNGGRSPFGARNPGQWMNPNKGNMSNNWDDMLNSPSRMGRMPGGWEAPSISTPNPIDIGDEFEDAGRDMPYQMRNLRNNSYR